MKNTFILVVALCLGWAMNTSAQEVENGPVITFEKEVHDYGTIKQGSDGNIDFKFTNTGNAPLILSGAKGSCSCTVANYPKEPIAPGESGVIRVKYNTERVGPINKSATVTSNAVNSPTMVLRIKGNVEAVQSGTPVNQSGPTN